MHDLSVITIVRDRQAHLMRLVEGLVASTVAPAELIVVDMSQKPTALPPLPFLSRRIDFETDGLALAAARNAGAREASNERLLFLDVDCIPRRNLVSVMNDELMANDALVCPEVRYLGPGGSCHTDDLTLETASVRHPVRSFPKIGRRPEPNAGLFWSLTFGIRRSTFNAIGGFDEGYFGYGAEDTDFGFRARDAGVPLMFLGGTGAFHQYHGVISPPLQHLSDIVRNANRFYTRWGVWPMDGWLKVFAAMGLVAFGESELRLLRQATPTEMQSATQPDSVYF